MSYVKLKAETAPSTPEAGYVVVYPKADKLMYQKDDAGTETVLAGGGGGGGSGDVVGPASATDNAIARYDSTTGKLIQDSLATVDDSGNIAVPALATVDGRDVSVDGGTLDTHVADTANPHATTKAQVGLTNVTDDAQLKIASNLSDLANASTARTNLGVAIGTDVQAYDAELAAIAGLTSAADKLPYFTGSGTAALTDITSAGRAILDDANAAAQRATLGVGAIGELASIKCSMEVGFGDQTSAVTAGEQQKISRATFGMTIIGWTMEADASGSIVVDIWKDTYANAPATVADTITGSAKPTLSSAQKNTSTTLTGWNTTINEGDSIIFNVDSTSTVKQVSLVIYGTRTT